MKKTTMYKRMFEDILVNTHSERQKVISTALLVRMYINDVTISTDDFEELYDYIANKDKELYHKAFKLREAFALAEEAVEI